jgi:hypothetical protein
MHHLRIVVSEPADGSDALRSSVLVRGTTSDDGGVVRIDVFRNGELLRERPVETDTFFEQWVRLVPLLPGEENRLDFVAFDRRGGEGSASIVINGRAIDDQDAPALVVQSPVADESLGATLIEVRGAATDANGVRTRRGAKHSPRPRRC